MSDGRGGTAGSLDGQVIDGRFEVLELLEAGAMGEVYLVRQLSLGMLRALKTIKPDAADFAREGKRFRREALALSRLAHESIVQVIDFGYLPEPRALHYLVMEYVKGVSAQAAVDEGGPMPPWHAVQLLRQLADALAYAHAAGIVHRDLKPANILLREQVPPYGDEPIPIKVVDFGLVRILTDETLTKITAEEQILGTPRFMAPEQCRSTQVGPPADIYALGGVAFYLLSGAPVFQTRSVFEMLIAHTRKTPDRLSERCPQLELPPELDDLVQRCLAKRPEERPTAAEVKLVLDEICDGLVPHPARSASPAAVAPAVEGGVEHTSLDVAELSRLIWADPDDSATDYTPGIRPVLDALFNQISTLLVNLARQVVGQLESTEEIQAQIEEISRLEAKISELELETALLEAEMVDPGGERANAAELQQRRSALKRRIARLGLKRDESARRLFELTLGRKQQIESSAAAGAFVDLEKLVEQYLRLSGTTAANERLAATEPSRTG